MTTPQRFVCSTPACFPKPAS